MPFHAYRCSRSLSFTITILDHTISDRARDTDGEVCARAGPRHPPSVPNKGSPHWGAEVYFNFCCEMCCVVVWCSSQILNSLPFMPLFVRSVKVVCFYGPVVLLCLQVLCLCASKSGKIKPGALRSFAGLCNGASGMTN
jgi:hypothetical protein